VSASGAAVAAIVTIGVYGFDPRSFRDVLHAADVGRWSTYANDGGTREPLRLGQRASPSGWRSATACR
jgi:hypothetical protein